MPFSVATTSRPPRRLEGGGFEIRDIFSGFAHQHIDPFLMWHELPRKFHRPGSFPGAPMHPHRGFMECPYMKEITAETGATTMEATVQAGGKSRTAQLHPGCFELGKVGVGMEHEMVTPDNWSGYMHVFQLWVNLPAANKFDAPYFQNASPSALPVVELDDGVRVKIMHGELAGERSPTECDTVQWQYLDFMIDGLGAARHEPPPEMTTAFVYVYAGRALVAGEQVGEGTLAVLDGEGELVVSAGSDAGCGFLFIAGKPLNERVVSHGPFVMSTRQQIQQCFHDFQAGRLCPKEITQINYD